MPVWGDPEGRKERKFRRVVKSAGYAIGGGVGLMFVKYLFPDFADQDRARALFNGLGIWLVVYGLLIGLTIAVKRDWVLRVNGVLVFFVTPVVLFRLLSDAW